MTSIGTAVLILAFGLLIFGLMRGGCCGVKKNRHGQPGPDQAPDPGREARKRHKGGCCG